MKKILIILFFFSINSYSQTTYKSFFDLSTPEKCWVFFHPFKAKKALKISKETLSVTDSIKKVNVLDTDINGGLLDAFKHSFWMFRLGQEIGNKAALKLGEAHEKGNYQTYKKNKKEDNFVPDKPSTEMDLHNNAVGLRIGTQFVYVVPGLGRLFSSNRLLSDKCFNALQKSELKIINP